MGLFRKRDDEFMLFPEDEENKFGSNNTLHHSPTALTPEELLAHNENNEPTYNNSATNALEALKKRIADSVNGEASQASIPNEKKVIEKPIETVPAEKATDTAEPAKASLVDKCHPYFLDDDGKDAHINHEPLYKLQSVADIIKSDSEETIKRLSQKYGLTFEDERKTPVITKDEPEVFEDTVTKPPKPETAPTSTIIISDIDVPDKQKIKIPEINSKTTTITFMPVTQGDTSAPHMTVTTKTQSIDLTGELIKPTITAHTESNDGITLEQSEFEEFTPQEEFTDIKQAGKLIRRFSLKKKNSFLITAFTFIITAILALMKLPFMANLMLKNIMPISIICTAMLFIVVLLNCTMFADIIKLFSKKANADGAAAIASIFTLGYAVLGIIKGEIIVDMLLVNSLILFFRALAKFQNASVMLSNLKLIATNTPKNAIKLISDNAITFAMVKDSIEGDALIAAPQKTDFINDYMKYSTYTSFLGGKMNIINIFSLLLSVIVGVTCATYFDGLVHGFYAAAAIQCFTAVPILFFIDTLPLYSSAKKLIKTGAMIAGKAGAEQLEMANAAVLNSTDLFPNGTVTLHHIEILAENSLDDTLIRAASLTEYIGSTLTPIFKEIAKSGNVASLPDTDTVKYEDRMGISGWVDNRLLFIGNRTLMEAHGIDVPSVEVDRKILRSGYFPVYVATGDKACALLSIQYSVNPKIAHELRRLTGLGVTLLVNNSDPNLTEEMICDYLGLYNDSVKVMTAAGCHLYKNTVVRTAKAPAPAAYRSNPIALPSIINCASKFKKSNLLLTVVYIISLVFSVVAFAYASLGGSGTLVSETTTLLYVLISTVIAYLIYLTEKP